MNEIQETSKAQSEKRSVVVALANRFNVEPSAMMSVLKETIAPKASEAQLAAFCIVCHEYGLNPITKEIYAFPGKGGEIVPMVGVDGWIHLMNAHPQFDGVNAKMSEDGTECTVTIYRKDRKHPVVVTEYLDECKRNTDPWNKSPRRMLRHKAIIQGARVAFGFSGIYDEDEAKDVANGTSSMRDVTPKATGMKLQASIPQVTLSAVDWLEGVLENSGKSVNDLYKVLSAIGYVVPESMLITPELADEVMNDPEARAAMSESGFNL